MGAENDGGCLPIHAGCEACAWIAPRWAGLHAEVAFLLQGRPGRMAAQPADDDTEEG